MLRSFSRLRAVRNGLLVGYDEAVDDDREGAEHLADVAPPLLTELLVPVDGDAQAVGETGLLLPAELAQLGAVHSVAVVVERTVVGVLDPLLELLGGVVRDADLLQQMAAQLQVGDLVVRADVVDLANLTAVHNGVESVGSIAGKKVAAGRATVTVQDNGLTTVQEAGELGDDLCGSLLVNQKPGASVVCNWWEKRHTLGVLVRAVDVVTANDDSGQLEALHVRVDKHLSGGLAGSVGVGGGQNA